MTRVGIVGLGFGEGVHVPGFRALDGVDVVVVCGREPERTRAAAQRNEIPDWTTDVRELASSDVDIISVASPPHLHHEHARTVLAAGRALLCEKPLALNGAEADDLVAAATAAGAPAIVDFEFRTVPAFVRAHELLAEGAIGAVESVDVHWRLPSRGGQAPSWKDRAELGGGTLLSLGVHAFDYVEWLVAPIARVTGRLLGEPTPLRDADDGFAGTLSLIDGRRATIDLSTRAADRHGHVIAINGANGTLELRNPDLADYMRSFELFAEGRPVELPPPARDADGELLDGRLPAFTALAARLVDAVRTRGTCEPSLARGARAQKVADAVREAARTGDWADVAV